LLSCEAGIGSGESPSRQPIALSAGKNNPKTWDSRMHEKQGTCVLAIQHALERTVTMASWA
jgi:hypothetical protein